MHQGDLRRRLTTLEGGLRACEVLRGGAASQFVGRSPPAVRRARASGLSTSGRYGTPARAHPSRDEAQVRTTTPPRSKQTSRMSGGSGRQAWRERITRVSACRAHPRPRRRVGADLLPFGPFCPDRAATRTRNLLLRIEFLRLGEGFASLDRSPSGVLLYKSRRGRWECRPRPRPAHGRLTVALHGMSGRIWVVEMGGGDSAPRSVRLERNGLLLRVRLILVAEGRFGQSNAVVAAAVAGRGALSCVREERS